MKKPTKKQVIYSILRLIMLIFVFLTSYFFIHTHNRDICPECNRKHIQSYELGYNKGVSDEYQKSTKELAKVIKEYQGKANFLDKYIVMVTVSGNKYHFHGCRYLENKEFWAYNIEAAKSRGYQECSVCGKGK